MQPKVYKSQNVPETVEYIGKNKYCYNYNIVETDDLENKYLFSSITVYGKPTYQECVKLIIREYLTQEEEFDLINSYNKAIIAGEAESEDILKYENYLKLVSDIKTNCKKDFKIE